MVRRDKRRWEKADGDSDGKLTEKEFAFFLHPEEAEHMREIVVEVWKVIVYKLEAVFFQ